MLFINGDVSYSINIKRDVQYNKEVGHAPVYIELENNWHMAKNSWIAIKSEKVT